MDPQKIPLSVRVLLESTGIPFAVAEYGERAVIFSQGDTGHSVMHLEKGRVRLAVMAPSGHQAICGLLGTGAFLGEEVLAGRFVRRQTATAMTDTEVIVIAKAQMTRVLRTHQGIADRFLAHVVARHNRLEADLTDQILHSSAQRLARTLLMLAGCDDGRPCRCALPHVSQGVIAEMVGTTRSRVNLFMNKFKKLGFIEEDGGVLQVKPALLHVIHDWQSSASIGTPSAMLEASTPQKRHSPRASH
jgi:CRP-like cAMP-binding protein